MTTPWKAFQPARAVLVCFATFVSSFAHDAWTSRRGPTTPTELPVARNSKALLLCGHHLVFTGRRTGVAGTRTRAAPAGPAEQFGPLLRRDPPA